MQWRKNNITNTSRAAARRKQRLACKFNDNNNLNS
jgi:hypothetical protein